MSAARDLRDEARREVREHRDPAVEKLARAWHTLRAPRWAPVHAADVITSLENDVFPDLGPIHKQSA